MARPRNADLPPRDRRHRLMARPRKAAEPVQELSAADRENPEKLSGSDLRELAHRRGLARSEVERMDDDKIRIQLRYLTHRQYDDEVV